MSIGERIRELRKEKRLTLIQLADLMGLSQATLSKYESGEINIPIKRLRKLADILGTTVEELIVYENSTPRTIDFRKTNPTIVSEEVFEKCVRVLGYNIHSDEYQYYITDTKQVLIAVVSKTLMFEIHTSNIGFTNLDSAEKTKLMNLIFDYSRGRGLIVEDNVDVNGHGE